MKKAVKIILIIFAVLVVLGIISSLTSNNTPSNSSSNENKNPETKTNFAIGDKISVSNVDYTIKEVFTLPLVGSEYINKEADGIFVIISLEIKNNKNNEILLTSSDFKIKDSQNRVYNADSSAGFYLDTMGYKSFMFKQLGAGLSTNGEIVFDVPKDDTGLILEISGEGIFYVTNCGVLTGKPKESQSCTLPKVKSATLSIDRVQIQLANLYPTRITVTNTGDVTINPKFDVYVYDSNGKEVCSGSPLTDEFGSISAGEKQTGEFTVMGCMFNKDGTYTLKVDLLNSDYSRLDSKTKDFTVDYWGKFGF